MSESVPDPAHPESIMIVHARNAHLLVTRVMFLALSLPQDHPHPGTFENRRRQLIRIPLNSRAGPARHPEVLRRI
jgi:hypothetical protein